MIKIIKEIPVTDSWENYLKKLPNGAKVWDFDKIDQNFKDVKIRVIFSERGNKGKTYNLKRFAKEQFDKNGKPSIWVRNTIISLKMEAKRFLDHNTTMIDPIFWKDLKIVNEGASWVVKNKANKNVFILLSLNDVNKMKGTRLDVNNIIFDEINEDTSQIRSGLIKSIDSLVHSATNSVKNYGKVEETRLWFLGNNKSINHEYLIKLGIRDNKHPLALYTAIYEGKRSPLCVKLCSKFDPKEQEEITKKAFEMNDWKFIHSYVLDEASHSYFNNTFENENLKVMPLDLNNFFIEQALRFTIVYEKYYLNVYNIGTLGKYTFHHYHIAEVPKEKASKNIITNYSEYVNDNSLFLGKASKVFSVLVASQNISYQDNLSRVLFLNNCFGKVGG